MVTSFSTILIRELRRMKEAQGSQVSGTPRKRKRITKHDSPIPLPSIEVQRTFGALGNINCTPLRMLLTLALPTFFHSIHLLLSPETTSEQTIQATHILSTSFVSHFKEIISNPKSHHHSLPDSTHATHSIFALLTSVYTSPKLPSQRHIIADILMTFVTNILSLINESCLLLVKSAIYNDPSPKDYREILAQGMLTIFSMTGVDNILRQGILLGLLVEFRKVRCEKRTGKVALLARDDMLWYLYSLIEKVVEMTGMVGEIVGLQAQELVWECISAGVREEGTMSKGSWLAWKVCGLLCGIGAINLDMQTE